MRQDESPWFYVAVEFGRFGFGRCHAPILPRQYEVFIARVSVGFGGLSEGLLTAMRQAGRARDVPKAVWQRLNMSAGLYRLWVQMQARLTSYLIVCVFSVVTALLIVAVSLALGCTQ